MPLAAPPLPCATRLDIYDALIDTEPSTRAYQAAYAEAARLCGTCTSLCDDRITAGSSPRTAADFDDTEWIPARKRLVLPPGAQPERRPAAWSRLVAGLAGQGWTPAAIADALSVSERTVTNLLALAASDRAA